MQGEIVPTIKKRHLCILGATGSIGKSTLEVIRLHPEKYEVVSLTAHSSVDIMLAQCKEFLPAKVVMVCEKSAAKLTHALVELNLSHIKVFSGNDALIDLVKDPASDTIMAAIVGASGLLPTLAAVKEGKRVLLANKEMI